MIQSKKDASRFCNGKDNSTPPVRKNRPGFNSYLKVMLDEKTMGILHEMAVQVKNQIQESTDEQGKEEEVEKTMEQDTLESPKQDGKTSKKKKVLRFKPRSRASLHMTLFFGGETICELPQNELLDWHGRVSERLEKSGFHLEDSDSNSTESTGGYSFKLVGLKVFPPQRNNLIVGILEPAPEWHVLHNDICDLAKDESRSTALAEITKRSKGKWISHITLGNLYGGTKAQAKSLDSLLEDVFQSTLPSSDNDHRSNNNGCFLAWTSGIAMGGPVPKQVELDWDFQYGVSRRVASANNHEK